ncbi:MAG: hypothetical protein J7639_20715, partial [Paenibacillaceae bacterium]|nr:hypothetical protein [Paenibacillaceae bacterium]
MQIDTTLALRLFRWVIGCQETLPARIEADEEDAMFALIKKHRIERSFMNQYKLYKPTCFSSRLIEKIMHQEFISQTQFIKQVNALDKLSQHLLNGYQNPLIIIKGISIFGHTGSIRYSSDLDVLYFNNHMLNNFLIDSGFHPVTYPGSDHEEFTISNNEIFIEIHKFFPVFGYPYSLTSNNKDDEAISQNWITKKKITYDDLLTESVEGHWRHIKYPNVNMTIFIISCHLLSDFMFTTFDKNMIRLYNLISVYELCKSPNYCPQQLKLYADKYLGNDALRFVGNLLNFFYGENPLPNISHIPIEYLQRASGGKWIASQPIDFIYRTVDSIFASTGSNTVISKIGEKKHYYSTWESINSATGVDINNELADLQFTVHHTNDCVVFDLIVHFDLWEYRTEIDIIFDRFATFGIHWNECKDHIGDFITISYEKHDITIEYTSERSNIQIFIPFENVPYVANQSTLKAFIGIERTNGPGTPYLSGNTI